MCKCYRRVICFDTFPQFLIAGLKQGCFDNNDLHIVSGICRTHNVLNIFWVLINGVLSQLSSIEWIHLFFR